MLDPCRKRPGPSSVASRGDYDDPEDSAKFVKKLTFEVGIYRNHDVRDCAARMYDIRLPRLASDSNGRVGKGRVL